MGNELDKYIKKELKKSFSLKQIRNTLLKDGYKKDMVSEALSQFKEKEPRVSFDFPWKKLFLVLSVLIVLALLGYFVFEFINKAPKIEEPSISTFLPTVEEFVEFYKKIVYEPFNPEPSYAKWEMVANYTKEISIYTKEAARLKMESRGFVEGHYRRFRKILNFSEEPPNYLFFSFSISKYARDKVTEVIQEKLNEFQNNEFVIEYSRLPAYFPKWENEFIKLNEIVPGSGFGGLQYLEKINYADDLYYNQCIEFTKEDIWVQVCCSYPEETSNLICSRLVQPYAVNISARIEEIKQLK